MTLENTGIASKIKVMKTAVKMVSEEQAAARQCMDDIKQGRPGPPAMR